MKKTFTTALTGEEMQSPFGGYATTFPPQAGALQGSVKLCTHKSLYFKHGLFCPLNRGKSGEAGKGEASVASQSAEWLFCHMTLKVNPVTFLRPL